MYCTCLLAYTKWYQTCCHYNFCPDLVRVHLSLSTCDSKKTDFWSISYPVCPPQGQKHLDINSIVNLSELVLVDYSQRGHCIEQSKLIGADTCQNEALLRPHLIQDIMLLPREIARPVASPLHVPIHQRQVLYALALIWCCRKALVYGAKHATSSFSMEEKMSTPYVKHLSKWWQIWKV